MKIEFTILLVLSIITSNLPAQVRTTNINPNILFIAVDDLNDWVGFLGGHAGMEIKTPNLDKLAASGMIFTNAHTPAPACAPTRAAILSGVHHTRSGADNVWWGDGPKWREFDALKDVQTLEQCFKEQGYTTLGAGKIYHSQAPPWAPTSQVEPENWDFYYPSAYISHPHQVRAPSEVIYPDSVDDSTRPGGPKGWWTWGAIPLPDEKMADYHVVDWVRYQLSLKHEKPFFLAAGVWKPHDPWEVPQKYFDMYPLHEIVLPKCKIDDMDDAYDHGRRWIHKWVLDNRQWEKVVQSYAASISFADAMIGRLIDAFNASEYADNTILVLWSDHGMHMGEKDNIEKFTLYEKSTRVPLIIKVPGITKPGSSCDQPVSLMDLYPTLVDLAGLQKPPHLDGRSLLPQLMNPDLETGPVISSYKFSWAEKPIIGHAVRSLRYRYIYFPEANFEELYDHQNDPEEWENIAYKREHRQVIEQHRQTLLEMLPNLTWTDNPPAGFSINDQGEVKKDDFISFVSKD